MASRELLKQTCMEPDLVAYSRLDHKQKAFFPHSASVCCILSCL
jgi:hypothetical protein